jgi:hypothetical protein
MLFHIRYKWLVGDEHHIISSSRHDSDFENFFNTHCYNLSAVNGSRPPYWAFSVSMSFFWKCAANPKERLRWCRRHQKSEIWDVGRPIHTWKESPPLISHVPTCKHYKLREGVINSSKTSRQTISCLCSIGIPTCLLNALSLLSSKTRMNI